MARENRKLKSVFKFLIIAVVVLLLVLICAGGYKVMYDAFADTAMAEEGKGRDVTLRIDSGMSAYQIGERLRDNGLIDNPLVFAVQAKLFTESGKELLPGTYTLNTSMTAQEIIEVLETEKSESGDADR